MEHSFKELLNKKEEEFECLKQSMIEFNNGINDYMFELYSCMNDKEVYTFYEEQVERLLNEIIHLRGFIKT